MEIAAGLVIVRLRGLGSTVWVAGPGWRESFLFDSSEGALT